jgi:hypothetical protein
MGIFDSILDDVVDLGDWIGTAAGEVADFASDNGNLLQKGFSGLQYVLDDQDQRTKSAMKQSGFSTQSGTTGTQGNAVDPRKADYGLANYAPDAAAIEAKWHALLTKFVNPQQTAVKR